MSATLQAIKDKSMVDSNSAEEVIIDCKIDNLYYGQFLAVRDSHIPIEKGKITAFIGPSGCGKSTALRCLNRMNDLIRGFRFEGMCISAARTFTPQTWIPSSYAAISAWFSSSPIPLP